ITKSDAVVIEINPRLTTAYLGARRALAGNIAALALDACLGSLPAPPPVQRSVRFDARGRITAEREIVHHPSFRGTVTRRILPRTVPASSVSSHFLTRSS